MDHQRIKIPLKAPVQSLCWRGDVLVDWAGGNCVIHANGEVSRPYSRWAFYFDAAIQSRSGRHAAIYQRLGTKAVILDNGKLVREINRSFYHANVYEYPITFLQHPDGRELVAHCPDEYNRIEIKEVVSGRRLSDSSDRNPQDFFHSRLSVSPDGKRLLSAGWVWHPFNSAATWLISDVLADAKALDRANRPDESSSTEINTAIFLEGDRILMSSNPDADDLGNETESPFLPGCMGIFNFRTQAFEAVAKVEEITGNMMWLGDGLIVGFYETPKVIDLGTGKIIHRWGDLSTGKQSSSICHHLEKLPTMAIDHDRKRFAVATKDQITVVQF